MVTQKKILVSKRIFDIIASTMILLLCTPFILIILLLIKVDQILRGRYRDPLFYREVRFSYGEPFLLYKFNLFKYEIIEELKKNGNFIHTKELERNGSITKIGWCLKQIYMDELPQFFCVLKGDMSIVGPRPVNQKVHTMCLEKNFLDKIRVPAGITGNYQSHKNTFGAKAWDLDKEYADYYHTKPCYKLLLFDFVIIIRTIKVILLARGV